MKKTNQFYLDDVLKAIKTIEKYTLQVNFNQFRQDQMRHDASIRQLEIIGEAANKLSKDFPKTNPNFPLKQAVEMRNFLIHGYDEIDLKKVWKTIQKDLPDLKTQAKKLLEK